MNVGDDTTAGDCGLNEGVELLVSSDCELEMSRCDSLHLQIFACIASQFQDLSSTILEDGSCIYG